MSRTAATAEPRAGAGGLARVAADDLRSILPCQARDLCYEANGARLLDRLSFTLDAGPCTVVLGPNGAGKSLLLRLLHGLIRPTAGAVAWAGLDPAEAMRRQAMVFQRPVLLRRSAAANVAYGLSVKGVGRRERAAAVERALARAHLSHLADRPARRLSGGEQQRLAIARAWAVQPQVLLLDEPTSSLDPAATRAVEELIGAIRGVGTKIVITTHDLGQARRLADEVLFLHRGRLVETGPADDFFARPRTPEAADFIAGRLLR
ncbi:MAG TPA: ATP-binding cassette domain-containing protein [Dongiaceae bacterium]|nr:ATP-binding cassette domain-containing protein [Dongiaceae bacterium]